MRRGQSGEADPYQRWLNEQRLDVQLQIFTAAREQLGETLNRQRGDYLGIVLSIESTLAAIFVDLITTDQAAEDLLTEVFLDRVPGGDRLGLFEQLRKSLEITAETRSLSRDLNKVVRRRNLLAHGRSEINWTGDTITFKGHLDELTAAELLEWRDLALQTWLALLRLHARLIVDRRPKQARKWMKPFLEKYAEEAQS